MKALCAWWMAGLAVTLTISAVGQAPDLSKLDIVERSLPDGPVALVDNIPISRESFLIAYRTQLAALALQSKTRDPEDSARVKTALRCLADLIQREILHQEGVKRKIAVSDADVQAAYAKRVKGLQEQAEKHGAPVPSEAEILERTGETREGALADLRKSMLIRKTREAIAKEKKVTVPEAEIKTFYEKNPQLFQRPSQVHLFQIFLQPKPNAQKADEAAWNAAQKEMEKALARIRAGEKFEAVAKSVSEAPDRVRGGDMGLLPAAQIPPFIMAALEKMSPGDLSGVIRSELGLHLIKLIEKQATENISFEEARTKIADLLMDSKTDAAAYDFCQPMLDDPNRVRFFLQLERTLASIPEFAGNAAKDPAPAPAKNSAPTAAKENAPAAKPAKNKKK